MAVARFLHTDALRLGSPVAGFSESPDWLRKVATSAVRTAVTNLFEAAIAGRCQFVLIAGRLTETDQDLDLAVGWLASQMASLRAHGIRLILAGHTEDEFSALRRLDAILVPPGHRIDVGISTGDCVEFSVTPATAAARSGTLAIEVASGHFFRPHSDFAYVAVPGQSASSLSNSSETAAVAHDRHLRITAGCPQAIQPTERGVCGCQIVEVDFVRQSLTARFCPTDVIRYTQELFTCRPGMSISQLCEALRERSRTIAATGRCTIAVEWIIDGQLTLEAGSQESLCEPDLLRELRQHLHAGHSGAWPCRIRFSDQSSLDAGSCRSVVVQEFASIVRERLIRNSNRNQAEWSPACVPLGGPSEAPVGLQLLRRVA